MEGWKIEVAEELREKAASCRRLAIRARTDAGKQALLGLAQQFDVEARRINPGSEKR